MLTEKSSHDTNYATSQGSMGLPDPVITILGEDPGSRRRCILNGNAFQQDAVVTFRGWQYAVFYSYLSRNSQPGVMSGSDNIKEKQPEDPEPLYIHLARRELPVPGSQLSEDSVGQVQKGGEWEILVFDDYPQTVDDGHNTVQMGICPGDGTIHLSYDHHCDVLRYRHSLLNLALTPKLFPWTPALFTLTLDYLPGLLSTHPHFSYVTYPRFGRLGPSSMFLSFRDGKAGLGNDHLYLYRPERGHFEFVGTHLTGVGSNPYINGMDYSEREGGRLHVTWVYRGFVEYEGWDDLSDTKHKQQAGPNGAENNHDLCYAWSGDLGYTWRNGRGGVVADLRGGGGKIRESDGREREVSETIRNNAEGIVAFRIPKGKGLMNQEAQAVDSEGGVHVLNRDCMSEGGRHLWKHYYRSPGDGTWTQHSLQPITNGSRRGRLAISKQDDLYIILPDSTTASLKILKAAKADGYARYEEVWVGQGLTGEPLIDSARLQHDNVLSLFILRDHEGLPGRRNVVIMDFPL